MGRDYIWDAAIVGAGPAGSATAALLSRRGFRVLLLDRARFPRSKPCAEYLAPGAVAILERLGCAEQVREKSAGIAGMRIMAHDGTVFHGRFPPPASGLGISRDVLDLVLLEHAVAQGARVLQEITVTDVYSGERDVLVMARTNSGALVRFRARLLVGADGLRSRVARKLGVARRGPLRRVALVRHASGISFENHLAEMHLGPRGYVGIAPVGPDIANLAIVTRAGQHSGRSVEEWFHHLLGEYPGIRDRIARASFEDAVQTTGPFDYRATRCVGHRTVLVGDAAAFYDPFTGDGIYAALRGAELLDRCLALNLERDQLTERALAPYRRAWNLALAPKRAWERIVGRAVSSARWFPWLARAFAACPPLADFAVRLAGHALSATRGQRPDRETSPDFPRLRRHEAPVTGTPA